MNIIICINDNIFLKKLDEMICTYLQQYTTITYNLTYYQKVSDLMTHHIEADTILILDSIYPHITGIDVAQKLRGNATNFILIFVANDLKYVLNAFHVNTFRYILKHQLTLYFEEALSSAIQLLDVLPPSIKLKFVGYTSEKITISNIIYFESYLHKIYCHIRQATHSKYLYSSLTKLQMQLPYQQFLRIHQSYLINRQYLIDIQNDMVKLVGDISLPIGQKYSKQIKLLWDRNIKD